MFMLLLYVMATHSYGLYDCYTKLSYQQTYLIQVACWLGSSTIWMITEVTDDCGVKHDKTLATDGVKEENAFDLHTTDFIPW